MMSEACLHMLTSPSCAHPHCCIDRYVCFCAYVSCASFSSPSFSSSLFFPDSFAAGKCPEHKHTRLLRPCPSFRGDWVTHTNCLAPSLWVCGGPGADPRNNHIICHVNVQWALEALPPGLLNMPSDHAFHRHIPCPSFSGK